MPKIIKKFVKEITGEAKSFGKQLTTDNPVLVKNEFFAVLVYTGKTHDLFLEEFANLTKEGYRLSGITDPMGFPIVGLQLKIAKIFFFQNYKWLRS